MIVQYLVLIGIISLSFTQGLNYKTRTVRNDLSESLDLDEAYLTVRNTDYSNTVVLLGNKIVCESCDPEQLITVDSNQSATTIIDTKYAYDLELRVWSSNMSLLCQFASYKFDEHGTYVLDIMHDTPATDVCSIEQTGNPSSYMAPAILGILFVILYAVLVQLWPYIYKSRHFGYFRTNILRQRPINENLGTTSPASVEVIVVQRQQILNEPDEDVSRVIGSTSQLPLPNLTHLSADKTRTKRALPKRLRALGYVSRIFTDGDDLCQLWWYVFGGGGYWFFDHSIWNGLTLADLVFPWFTWMMGVSIVLSQRSLRSKNVRKRSILLKICRRSFILFLLDEDVEQSLSTELFKSVFQFWIQWLVVILVITVWILITFLLPVPNCPTGYLGPGGKHDHGRHANCTGGAAGYIDKTILGISHLYDQPTCQEIYATEIPYDPEGILGNLTGILLCYLGVQAGHIFVHSTRVRRLCIHWLVSSIVCGTLGLILSGGGHSNSWIPINKNLWSLTFVLILASLAFMILTVLYFLVDVHQWFTGAPFLWLGMNSIAIYICHGRFGNSFPVQFGSGSTHAAQLAMHLYGAFFWSVIAGLMYRKKFFIAI